MVGPQCWRVPQSPRDPQEQPSVPIQGGEGLARSPGAAESTQGSAGEKLLDGFMN